MSDVAKTPREELECKKKYLYEHSMFWECNDGSKCQILEDDVVRLLNEQQNIIKEQNKQIEEWEFSFRTEMAHHRVAEKELQEKIKEQQATIRKLQDLCGQSDGENAKLRIENKRLQEEIERLQKIIDLTSYQLEVQDRILKEVRE